MNKEKALKLIQNARKAHMFQMDKIEAAIEGKIVDTPTALAKTECVFGKWLYSDKNDLRNILGILFYDNLDVLHSKWHNEYLRIFEILFKKDNKRGFLSKMLESSKVSAMDLDKARLYHSELKVTTEELLKALGSSERRIAALAESKFL